MSRSETQRRAGILGRCGTIIAGAAVAALVFAGPAGAQTKVRYSEVIRSIFYLPSYVAIEKGYFNKEGLDLDMSTAWGSDRSIPQLLAGSIDVALLGPESAIYIQNSPSPLKVKIFCALTATDGLIVISRSKIEPAAFSWDMIKGKVFLDWRAGVTPQLTGEWVLRKNGLDPRREFTYITNVASGNRGQAWIAGQGDFGTFFEPTVSQFEKMGIGHAVASIGQQIGTMDYTVFMATDRYIADNPKAVQSWCNAIHRAQRDVAQEDPAALGDLVSKHFPELDRDVLVSSIQRYRTLGIWKTDPVTEPGAIETMQDIMVAGGVLETKDRVAYDSVVMRRFAEAAKQAVK